MRTKVWLPGVAIFLVMLGVVAVTTGKRGVVLLLVFYAVFAALIPLGGLLKYIIIRIERHLERTYKPRRQTTPPRPPQHHDGFDHPA